MTCEGCPFAFTNESEYVQGLGCLPTPYEIIEMKRKSWHNWACHSNEHILCKGFEEFINYMKNNSFDKGKYDLDLSKGKLISYDTWYHQGEKEAIRQTK